MPILALPSRRWLFTRTGINAATYRSDRFRNQGVAAFGARESIVRSRPLGMDAVAIKIRDGLAERGLSRRIAADIVRGFFDKWAEGISHVEDDSQDIVFVVVELDPRKFGDSWRCAVGPAEKFDDYLKSLPRPMKRVLLIHLGEVLADIRRRAAEAGLDLSGLRFFVPSHHPMLEEIKVEYAKWRAENNVAEARGKFPKVDPRRRRAIGELLQ